MDSPRAVVLTATIGEPALAAAIASVQAQTYRPIRHVIVIDGASHEQLARQAIDRAAPSAVPVEVVVRETNTGESDHYGHRIYAASDQLASEDLVFFLDADNVFDPEHVDICAQAIMSTGATWAYSLRRIIDDDGRWFCPDNCDSLGFWPRYRTLHLGLSVLPPDEEEFLLAVPYLVDTSCYCLRREVVARWSRCWEVGRGADCVFATELIRHEVGVGTGQRTVGYRLDVKAHPTTAEYFLKGNDLARQHYGSPLPWITRQPGGTVAPPDELVTRFGR